MKRLHPGARWLFRIGFYLKALFVTIFLGIFVIGGSIPITGDVIFANKLLLLIFSLPLILIVFAEIYARLAYINWKYDFQNSELKIEKGIIWKTYKSIPYERIQNIDIHRGILARMLGFSILNIQTAGYSFGGTNGNLSEGYIPAVSMKEAEDYRSFLMKKIGRRQGL
jgi:membrane protein YdbS with pleckstrin-like domain